MGSVPTGDSDGNDALKRRITALERAVAFLRSAKATTGKAGTTGSSRFYDDSGHLLANIGRQADGLIGLRAFRPDGTTLSEFLGIGVFGLSYTAIRDRNTRVILGDDQSGGLNRPRVPLGQWVPNAPMGANPVAPTSTTWVTLAKCFGYPQSSFARFDVRVSSSASGCTGNVRVLDPLGVQMGATLPVAALTTSEATLGPVAIPSWPSIQDLPGSFLLQAQLTAGAGTIGAVGLGAWGCGSNDIS